MMQKRDHIAELEGRLKDLDPAQREDALRRLLEQVEAGDITFPPARDLVNMHCHTFFSFNAYGHSPTSLAWLARREGFRAAGIVDFDVLDGVEEFLHTGDALGLRGGAGLETRVFIPDYADEVINSPGEPGICYHIGAGFTSAQVPAEVRPLFLSLRERAAARNKAIVARVNAYLDPVRIDLERDVLPLTPAGHPTERHLTLAYIRAAERTFPNPSPFWAEKLGMGLPAVEASRRDSAGFQNLVRAQLMRRGGVGYIPPTPEMFPTLDELTRLIHAGGALSCIAWLDGTSEVESRPEEWLDFLIQHGAAAINIIPDRNWNLSDAHVRAAKVANLHRIIQLAHARDLPILVGTEMNSFGQKIVDDFDAPALLPYRRLFLDGAHFLYAHTLLARALGLGFHSGWARRHFSDRRARNRFYIQAGYALAPGAHTLQRLRTLPRDPKPQEILAL